MFGDYVQSVRESKQLSLQKVSVDLGYKNRQNFWNIENGLTFGNKETLRRIADYLQVDFTELVCRKYLEKIHQDLPEISSEVLTKCLEILKQSVNS